MNLASWKHWLTLLGLPTLAAFLTAFQQSGDSFTHAALSNDVKVGLAVLVGTFLGLIQPNVAQTKQVGELKAKIVTMLAKGASIVLLVFSFRGCSAAQDVQAIGPTLSTLLCVEQVVSSDVAAGDPWEQCVADAVSKCGADASTVATVWAAHNAAEVREGFVPKMPVPNVDGGGGA